MSVQTDSRLRFRNVDADPTDPVQSWPLEALQAALERGTLVDWRRMFAVIRRDPWGPTARNVEYILTYSRPYGTTELFERGIAVARQNAERLEKAEVAAQLAELLASSGLSASAFAKSLGTSPSRLSTYLSTKVTPSAALMIRARNLAAAYASVRH